MSTQLSRKQIILITIITAILLVGAIISFVVATTHKNTAQPETPSTITEIAGEYVLEEEKANPTSTSTSSTTTESSSALPKTGPKDVLGLSLVAGFAVYLGTASLIKRSA